MSESAPSAPLERRYTRRAAARLLGLSALALPAGLTVREADAATAWCRTDPIVVINDVIVDIFVSAPLTAPLKVTGPTQVEVTVPVGVKAWTLLTDLGFGRGEVVTYKQSDRLRVRNGVVEVKVRVYVPSRDSSMPVRVEFAPRILGILNPDSAQGTANSWVALTTDL